MSIQTLLTKAIEFNASDIHLSSYLPPRIRVNGKIIPLNLNHINISNISIENILNEIMSEPIKKAFETHWETDFSYELPDGLRIRANIFREFQGISAVFRIIPSKIMTLDELNMPAIIKKIALLPSGLVLVTGPTGSGKSTTLAAMVDYINKNTHGHIITIEDPIEFVHQSHQCLIRQREVHRDTKGFSIALRSALREDPNVILVGELRDLETIRLAITAAETGHLVLATLHTRSAEKTIHRIVDVFPGDEKNSVRSILSESLEAVIAQTLVPNLNNTRTAALEIMITTPAIRHLIREDKTAQIISAIQTGQSLGMQTLEQHLVQLRNQGVISC